MTSFAEELFGTDVFLDAGALDKVIRNAAGTLTFQCRGRLPQRNYPGRCLHACPALRLRLGLELGVANWAAAAMMVGRSSSWVTGSEAVRCVPRRCSHCRCWRALVVPRGTALESSEQGRLHQATHLCSEFPVHAAGGGWLGSFGRTLILVRSWSRASVANILEPLRGHMAWHSLARHASGWSACGTIQIPIAR